MKKVLKIIYYNSIKMKNYFVFSLIKLFYTFNIYVDFFENYYLLLIYNSNSTTNQKYSNKIANFFIQKKSKKIFNLMFLHAYFSNIGHGLVSDQLNFIFQEYKKIISRILNVDKKIYITPDYYHKIGHFACVGYFIKAIKLKLIDYDQIYIIGPAKSYNQSLLRNFLRFKEVKFLEKEELNKDILNNLNCLTSYLDFFELKNKKKVRLEEFCSIVSNKWKKKNKEFFTISKKEHYDGIKFLKKFNIDINKKWFCILHVRDNRQFSKIRNSEIKKYKKAIEYITSQGGYVLRIGDRTMEALVNKEKFIDLTRINEFENHLIFLFKQARFFMVSVSGPGALSTLFNGPAIHLDCSPMYSILGKNKDFVLPRMYYRNNQLVSFFERLNTDLGKSVSLNYLKEKNINIKENTDDEILSATKEFFSKIKQNKQNKKSNLAKKISYEYKKKGINSLNIAKVIETKYKKFYLDDSVEDKKKSL